MALARYNQQTARSSWLKLGSGSECGGGGSGGGAPAPQSARVSSNGAGGMAVSRVPSPLHDGNTPVAENWCFTQRPRAGMMRAALERVGDRAKTPAAPQARSPQAKQRSGATTSDHRAPRPSPDLHGPP